MTSVIRAFSSRCRLAACVASGLVLALLLPSVASAQLSALGPSFPVSSGGMRGTDSAYDPTNDVYLLVGAYGAARGTFVSSAGAVIGSPFDLNGAPSGVFAHYPRVVYSPHLNSGAGGFLVTWHENAGGGIENVVLIRAVAYPSGPIGGIVTVNPGDGGSWWEAGPAAAYSPISQQFIVVWQSCCGGGSAVKYRMVDLNLQPLGSPIQVSGGYGRDPGVAWNPSNNEFGISYSGADLSSAISAFARVSGAGVLLRRNILHRAPGTYITDVAYNPDTTRYVTVYSSPITGGGTRGAEVDAQGDAVAEGLISGVVGAYDGLGIARNPVAGTFLLVGHHSTALNVGALELNKRGGRSGSERVITSTNPPPTIGSFYPRPMTSATAPRWVVTYAKDYADLYAQIVETITTGGGADVPVGGSAPAPTPTPTPGPAPPPPPPTGGCTTPDPFASIGGGTCYNGGWLAPGMVPPSAPPPAPTPTPTPGPTPPPPPPTGGCTTPDPFASLGGGTCYNGGWLPPGMAPPGGVTPTPTPAPGGCAGTDPFASIGGGRCINGGWVPNTAFLCSGLPDPFVAIGGGVCINGGWIPRTALGGGRP